MNQRTGNGKVKEVRRDKFRRPRQEDEWDSESVPHRSSSEKNLPSADSTSTAPVFSGGANAQTRHSAPSKNLGEKTRSRSRDGHVVYRRQERGKIRSGNFSQPTPENSPPTGRVSHSDTMRDNSGLTRHSSGGRSSSGIFYKQKSSIGTEHGSRLGKLAGHHESSRKNAHENEDSRLFRILNRLNNDSDRERQIIALRQLKDFFLNPDNAKSVETSYYNIIAYFDEVLQMRLHTDIRQEIASCLGALGPILDQDCKPFSILYTSLIRFIEWIYNNYFSDLSDDVKILLLRILLENLKNDKDTQKVNQLMGYIMTNTQVALENADNPDLLTAIVDVITFIASAYPSVFRNHFRDIVDILVGWHIDPSQMSCLTQFTSKALISFQQFWIADMPFSLTLLSQFLEDMEAYSEDLSQTKDTKPDETPPSADECLDKISSLVRVFMTVLKSLGNHASPNQNPSMTWNFLIDSLKCLLKCTTLIIDYTYDEELITAANDCATLLLVHCQTHSASASDDLLKYVSIIQSFPVENSSEVHLLSLLRLMGQAIKELGTQLPVDYIQYIFGPESLCQKLKFSPYHKIQQQLLSLQRSILGLKNVPLLEEAYRCLLQNLQDGFSNLLGEDIQLISTTIVTLSKEANSFKKAEVTVLSCLCALAEIGNAKHSIIGMWALKPSFFDLVANRLKPTSKSLATSYPAVHFAILYTLYSHCSRHGHFVSSSTLLSQSLTPSLNSGNGTANQTTLSSPILGNVSVMSPPSSGHLSSIMTLLTTVVKLQGVSFDCRSLCMRWIQEIVEALQHHAAKLCHLTEFLSFVEVILDSCFLMNPSLSISACLAMQILLKNAGSVLPENLLRKCYEACVLRLGSNNAHVRDVYAVLLSFLPLGIATSGFPFSVSKLGSQNQKIQNLANGDDDLDGFKISMQDIWAAQHGYMNRNATGEFSTQMFKKVLGFILLGQKPKDKDWHLNMYCAYQQIDRQTKVERLLWQVSRFNTSSLWFWATWESAQHCVLYKLRTALGKPQETFTTIEGSLKMYAGDINKIDRKTSIKASDRLETLHRVKLLLQFMEHLEKSMYNAYEGCAMALPSAPKNVRTFFRTNKGTCLEWLSRVRLATVKVAIQAGEYPTAVRHGFQLLQEKIDSENSQSSDFERLLIYLVQALINLQNPETVLGLYVWLREKTGRKFVWIKAAVDHAAGKFETAAHEYECVRKTLKCDDESKPFDQLETQNGPQSKSTNDQLLQSFLLQQTIDCYRSLGSWDEVLKWTEIKSNIHCTQNGRLYQNVYDGVGDLSYIKALSSFEDNLRGSSMGGSKILPDSKLLDGLSYNSAPVSWELEAQQIWAEQTLVMAAFNYYNKSKPTTIDTDAACDQMQKVTRHLSSLIQITSKSWPPTVIPRMGALYLSAYACSTVFQKGRKIPPAIISENIKLDPPDFSTSVLSSSLAWSSLWQHVAAKEQNVRPLLGSVLDLTLTVARLARKQQNTQLAQKLLVKNAVSISGFSEQSYTIADMIDLVNSLPFNEKLMKVQREGAKLLFASGNVNGAIDALMTSAITATNFILGRNSGNDLRLKVNDHSAIGEDISRSFLCIVKYVQHDSKCLPNFGNHQSSLNLVLENLLNLPFDLGLPLNSLDSRFQQRINDLHGASFSKDGVIGDSEVAIGRLLQRCVFQCPQLAKAWSSLAAWCYRWGRKVVDASSDGCIELLADEKNRILSLTPRNATPEERESVIQVMSQLHVTPEGDWEELGLDAYSDSVEITRFQLLNACPSLENTESLNHLIEMWCRVVKRAYCYYELAAKAYFQYLQLNAQQPMSEKYEDDNVTATLRLLRLVVKHATELRDVLEVELAQTPTAPWRGIIPQLFSRLSHPELYVRQSISDLLCRVAQASPHLIVFPAVVGSLTLKSNGLKENPAFLKACLSQELGLNDNLANSPDHSVLAKSLLPRGDLEDEELEEDEDDSQKAAIMQNCFAVLVDTLARQDASTIEEVKNLVHELRRITLLWDELWLGSLNLHHQEMQRRIQNLEDEISKVQSSVSLSKEEKIAIIKEKYSIFMKPTLFILEQLQNITKQTAETPHEQRFQDTFGKLINDTITSLKEPVDHGKPQQSWVLIRKLHQTLQQRLQQQTRSSLFMDQISPVLSTLQSTVIPMPGINTKSTTMVTIKSVQNTISILPTKTRPKKLAFFGSDGKKYTYLFKGLEDLHLDERIMQFLSIVNNMFVKTRKRGKALYNARHYSVTPLGPRSGLIEWVDGASPLFGLYKRWQQREVTAQALKNQSNPSTSAPTMLRPSEIYYNKLTPLLKEKDINNLDNRKEWPQQVMLQVLQELMVETPKDLLAKELWCSCSSASEWWEVTQTYNHSTAVMSIIGYIIGLGDRHLDNVLVDLSTGEVVHIDYNVCFEKGKNLRVPEKVPFRMTPNIETALGVTGIEGIFRVSCEHVLRVLRKGRETLLTLLEAFVYDPLVDWTPGNEGGYTGAVYGGGQIGASDTKHAKQQMEQDIAQAMLAVRVAEMKADWIKNRDELIASFPKLESYLKACVASQGHLNSAEIVLQDTCQQRAILEEAMGNNQHSLYTLPKRYQEYSMVKKMLISTQEAVKEKIAECNKWQNLHAMAFISMAGPELGKWCAETTNDLPLDGLSVAPVVEFLQSAGQGHLVQQSEQAESELGSLLQQQKVALRNCVELVRTYATVIMNYPPDYHQQNRCYQWKYWLESLLNDFTANRCQEIIGEFHNKYRIDNVDFNMVQISISVQFQLESHISDVNTKITRALERRRRDGLDDPEMLASMLEQTRSSIAHFLKENGDQGYSSLQCFVVSMVSGLGKKLLIMENAASAAGDCLVDLTSWEGDWFLDELCSTTNHICQFFRMVQKRNLSSMDVDPTIQTVFAVYNVFNALEDLSLNFQNIILPEAVKSIQTQEPTVLEMIEKLHTLISCVQVPLESIMEQLERNTRDIIMGLEMNDASLLQIVIYLRTEFNKIIPLDPNAVELSPGQMLYMGLNGLFSKLDADMVSLLNSLDMLDVPQPWKKVDIVREASALLPPVQSESTRINLTAIFFLKKLHAMQQFFILAQKMADSLQINNIHLTPDFILPTEDQLFKPIKIFIAEYVRKHVLGLASQAVGLALCGLMSYLDTDVTAEIELRDIGAEGRVALDQLAKKPFEVCSRLDKFNSPQLAQARTLIGNFDAAWRKDDMARRVDQSIVQYKATVHRLQLQLARHQWLYEDLLVQGNIGPLQNLVPPSRVTVMSEMRKSVQSLLSLESSIAASQDRYLGLTASIEQRMKWAAGANPSLSSTQAEFEIAIAEKTGLVINSTQITHELVNVCNAILHFEALRTRTNEAINSDNSFLSLINKCQDSCVVAESCSNQATPIEEHLLNLLPLPEEGIVTQEWISKLLEKVSSLLAASKDKLENQKMECFAQLDIVKTHIYSIRTMLTTHHKIMSELRNILKSLAKLEEQGSGSQGPIQAYINRYKTFSESVSKIVCNVIRDNEDMEPNQIEQIASQLEKLKRTTYDVYEELLELAGPLTTSKATNSNGFKQATPSIIESKEDSIISNTANPKLTANRLKAQEHLSGVSPTSQNHPPRQGSTENQKKGNVTRDPRTGKVIQERNTYATNVWKRVKMKLDGRDPDPNKRSSVTEQVDYVIKEATNLDNLAVLYEGWTPWV